MQTFCWKSNYTLFLYTLLTSWVWIQICMQTWIRIRIAICADLKLCLSWQFWLPYTLAIVTCKLMHVFYSRDQKAADELGLRVGRLILLLSRISSWFILTNLSCRMCSRIFFVKWLKKVLACWCWASKYCKNEKLLRGSFDNRVFCFFVNFSNRQWKEQT